MKKMLKESRIIKTYKKNNVENKIFTNNVGK